MPLLLFPALMFFASMTAMGQAAMLTVPVAPPVDPAPPVSPPKARRRDFRVIKGGQNVVLVGAERARYRHRKEP